MPRKKHVAGVEEWLVSWSRAGVVCDSGGGAEGGLGGLCGPFGTGWRMGLRHRIRKVANDPLLNAIVMDGRRRRGVY